MKKMSLLTARLLAILMFCYAVDLFAQVQALTEGTDGIIWAASENRLLQIHADGKVEITNVGDTIHALASDKNENLWLGTEKGLYLCRSGKCEPDSRIPTAPVIALAHDKSIWLATEDKLYGIQGNTITSAALPSTKLVTITVDQEGGVWVATRSSVQRFQNGKFEEMLKTSAQALASDPAGFVWVGAGHELIRWQNGKTQVFALPPPPANVRMRPPITSILSTRSGKLYLGTHSGLLLLAGQSFQKVSDLEVLALLEDGKGSIWVRHSEGLKRMANGKWINVRLPEQ